MAATTEALKLTHEPVVRSAVIPLRRRGLVFPIGAFALLLGLGVAWALWAGGTDEPTSSMAASEPELALPSATAPDAPSAQATAAPATAVASVVPAAVESSEPIPSVATLPTVERPQPTTQPATATSTKPSRGVDDCLVWDGSKWVPKPSCLGRK